MDFITNNIQLLGASFKCNLSNYTGGLKVLLANWQGGVIWKAKADMCLKIQSPWPLPEDTGRIEKLLLAENDPYRLIGDQLFEKCREEELTDLYSRLPAVRSS